MSEVVLQSNVKRPEITGVARMSYKATFFLSQHLSREDLYQIKKNISAIERVIINYWSISQDIYFIAFR